MRLIHFYNACVTILLTVVYISCSPNYHKYSKQYSFEVKSAVPDYSLWQYWAALPQKKDPSDSVPAPLQNESRDSSIDVFFIHPTTYTQKMTDGWNADVNNTYINAKTDYSSILYQASVFNAVAKIYAPRYRQAHLSAFFSTDTASANKAFDIAYSDIKNAFQYYLDNFNQGRPFIIASHSQGTKHASLLIKEMIEGTPLQQKLVMAYLIGMPVPSNYFSNLPPCRDSLQTGCFVSWRTFRQNYLPSYVKNENFKAVVTNPLTWCSNNELAPRNLNLGAVLYKFNKVFPSTNSAIIHNNVLWVSRPKFPGSFLYLSKNYHPGDINLFYMNIRHNLVGRVFAYFNK